MSTNDDRLQALQHSIKLKLQLLHAVASSFSDEEFAALAVRPPQPQPSPAVLYNMLVLVQSVVAREHAAGYRKPVPQATVDPVIASSRDGLAVMTTLALTVDPQALAAMKERVREMQAMALPAADATMLELTEAQLAYIEAARRARAETIL